MRREGDDPGGRPGDPQHRSHGASAGGRETSDFRRPGERQRGPLSRPRTPAEQVAFDVEAELRFHLEGRIAELVAEGWTPDAAREEAERRFGDVERIRTECRTLTKQRVQRQRRGERMRTVLQDLRYGVRVLLRSPGFALIAVLTLALGIGATTAMFSVVNAVLLQPLPFEEADRMVMVWETNAAQDIREEPPSPPNFHDWRTASQSFEALTAWEDWAPTLTGVERPEVLTAIATTPEFFRVLRIPMAAGRGFLPEEGVVGGEPVAVLSHRLSQRLYGGAASAIGQTLLLNDSPLEVVGVMPAGFDIPRQEVDVWLPVDYAQPGYHRQTRYLTVMGRLAPGITIEQAESELDLIAQRLETDYPESNMGWRIELVGAQEQIVGQAGTVLMVVLVAVGFVLLLACANVANLLLGRATAREAELALRTALGASRGRLRAQLVAETVVLGLAAGVLGAGIAYVAVRGFLALEPEAIPRATEIAVDGRVLGFAFLAALATGVFFGLVPAARALAGDPSDALREGGRSVGGRRKERARRILIVSEVALALVLLVGAGLSLRTLASLRALDPGYTTENVIAARVALGGPQYRGAEPKVRYFERIRERVAAIPDVVSVGVTSTLPLTPSGTDFDLPYHAEGMPLVPEQDAQQVDYRIIGPGYLETVGMTLLRGRDFSEFDRTDGEPVMLVNRTFAQQHWPGEDPIGKSVTLYYVQNREYEVVGLVADTRHRALSTPAQAQVFVALPQAEVLFGYMTIVARTRGDAALVEQQILAAGLEVDPTEPLYNIETIEQLLGNATARERLAALVLGAFAILAIVLSAAGIYGVISYQVARRTREIGVRMALGAARGSVVARVVGEAALLASVGVAIGVVVAMIATRSAESFLFGVTATDPATFAATSLLLLAVAVVSALVPALRAAAIHPVEALRYE